MRHLALLTLLAAGLAAATAADDPPPPPEDEFAFPSSEAAPPPRPPSRKWTTKPCRRCRPGPATSGRPRSVSTRPRRCAPTSRSRFPSTSELAATTRGFP